MMKSRVKRRRGVEREPKGGHFTIPQTVMNQLETIADFFNQPGAARMLLAARLVKDSEKGFCFRTADSGNWPVASFLKAQRRMYQARCRKGTPHPLSILKNELETTVPARSRVASNASPCSSNASSRRHYRR